MEKELAEAKVESFNRHVWKSIQKCFWQASAHKFEADAKEHDKAIAQTRQFQMMKKMLATKNEQLVDLRRRLQQYEPENVDVVDDDE